MKDYIMREIDKIGKLIEAILVKIGLLKRSGDSVAIYETTKIELLGKLNLNIDTLLEKGDIAEPLADDYGFSLDSMEKFASLLYEMAAASESKATRHNLLKGIKDIYDYLDKNGNSTSFDRYAILKGLE